MSVARFAAATDPGKRSLRSMVRRLAVVATSRVLWQLSGVRTLDGETEALTVEVFPGIGFYARPHSGSKPEAVIVNVGGANAPAIVATRDEQTRKASADIAANESAMFNTLATVHVTAGGTVDVRSVGGAAQALATNAALAALKSAIADAAVVAGDGGAAFKANLIAALSSWPGAGTTVLRGE